MENRIEIVQKGITEIKADAIVNAANEGLRHGGGVCGAIFKAAGIPELTRACTAIGHCRTGEAVATPGFNTKAKYIIHAVGPIYRDGDTNESDLLFSAYTNALKLAKNHMCKSVVFPLISSGIFGYPIKEAWEVALHACRLFLVENGDLDIRIIFAIPSFEIYRIGVQILDLLASGSSIDLHKEDEFVFFWKENEANGFMSQWYPCQFIVEGIEYQCAEQYMMAKKALLFNDLENYVLIMHEKNPGACKELGRKVRNFDENVWDRCCREIVYFGNFAKFSQNPELKEALLETGNRKLAEASPYDKVWGIGLKKDDLDVTNPTCWTGKNYLGHVLEKVREQIRNNYKK